MHRHARRALQTALLIPGLVVEGVMIAAADEPGTDPVATTATLAGTGPTAWVGVAAAVLVTAGLCLRRIAAPRRPRPRMHDVPTQRKAPPTS